MLIIDHYVSIKVYKLCSWTRVYSLAGDAFQVVMGLATLAAVAVAFPVEYDDFSHFAPAPVQYQHNVPLAKELVVEKYVSW